jgi:EAL domain-containing protein (putative c-di-GMP-specific phosphodiesterase class I)
MDQRNRRGNGVLWYLEGLTEEKGTLRRVPMLTLPFSIGRLPGLGLTLPSDLVSQHHAEIDRQGSALRLRDLGSANGTFLNGQRLSGEQPIEEGDILHFSRFEFRLGKVGAEEAEALLASTIAVSAESSTSVIDKSRILREMMRQQHVVSVFQPIVSFPERRLMGCEVLGRGILDGSHAGSVELFTAAKLLGAEAELSRLFRFRCVEDCRLFPQQLVFFINTHPAEVGSRDLVTSLERFRSAAPGLKAVLEIHEAAVADPPMIRELQQVLKELEIQLAYDDFGAGQARLLQLAEIPPDYLKFDISLIRDIHQASESKYTVLASLVSMALELGIQPIAEGVENEAEAGICHEVGFLFGQGYLFGEPQPASELLAQTR